ncbi:hypothetical protein Q669_01090 [Labrenzia sp. C1B10]|nr:hypothetical protein Q669_01090 [Labrenzia sp. C1B10]ERS00845.1 hypothetical protein Q675_08555 [Labrenzia sp. C1B70]
MLEIASEFLWWHRFARTREAGNLEKQAIGAGTGVSR